MPQSSKAWLERMLCHRYPGHKRPCAMRGSSLLAWTFARGVVSSPAVEGPCSLRIWAWVDGEIPRVGSALLNAASGNVSSQVTRLLLLELVCQGEVRLSPVVVGAISRSRDSSGRICDESGRWFTGPFAESSPTATSSKTEPLRQQPFSITMGTGRSHPSDRLRPL